MGIEKEKTPMELVKFHLEFAALMWQAGRVEEFMTTFQKAYDVAVANVKGESQ